MPERFLDQEGKLDLSKGDPTEFMFGFGRRYVVPPLGVQTDGWLTLFFRICPGRHFAQAAVFMYSACFLHIFSISPPLDEHGLPKKLEHKIRSRSILW